jgi:hypothetical protein
MIKKWLWVDDQPSTTEDFQTQLRTSGISYELFQNPDKLNWYITNFKQKKLSLAEFGLILDINLTGFNYITCPKEWSTEEKTIFWQTNKGYDAGLIYYEKVILGKPENPYWNPLPPVIFLTVVDTGYIVAENRLQELKHFWQKINNKNYSNVIWIKKWDALNNDILIKKMKEMEEKS